MCYQILVYVDIGGIVSLKSGAEKIIKILGLNVGIGAVDTVVFSPGLMGINILGVGAFEAAFGATVALMSIIVFAFGNYKLIVEKDKIIQTNEIKTVEDCIDALNQNYDKRIFEKDISTILEQIEMFQKKRETINEALLQKFDITEMSYSKFNGIISDIENVFYINIRSIINKLNAFDEKDYRRIGKYGEKKFSGEFINTKMRIYGGYISFIKEAIEDNEKIILKLDEILFELSKLDSLKDGELENMNAMKEIDDFISKVKLYDH